MTKRWFVFVLALSLLVCLGWREAETVPNGILTLFGPNFASRAGTLWGGGPATATGPASNLGDPRPYRSAVLSDLKPENAYWTAELDKTQPVRGVALVAHNGSAFGRWRVLASQTASPPAPVAVSPSTLLALENLTGQLDDIVDDPDAPDASWLLPAYPDDEVFLHVGFASPFTLQPGTDLQMVRIRVAKTEFGAPIDPPTLDVWVSEAGGPLQQIASELPVTVPALGGGPTSQVLIAEFDASLVTPGSDLEIAVRGNPRNDVSIQIGAIEWMAYKGGAYLDSGQLTFPASNYQDAHWGGLDTGELEPPLAQISAYILPETTDLRSFRIEIRDELNPAGEFVTGVLPITAAFDFGKGVPVGEGPRPEWLGTRDESVAGHHLGSRYGFRRRIPYEFRHVDAERVMSFLDVASRQGEDHGWLVVPFPDLLTADPTSPWVRSTLQWARLEDLSVDYAEARKMHAAFVAVDYL